MIDKSIKYKSGEEVCLGDRVVVRSFFFFKDAGTVVYIPRISSFHREMENNGIEYLGVKLDAGSFAAATIDPSTNMVINTKFIERGTFDEANALKGDQDIFEDDDGNSL